uniref:STAS domain-containing protein n=1 Tax=Pygocentrus nattereri TaxID=42514 RepID=A0AAR2KDI2_PYGNA
MEPLFSDPMDGQRSLNDRLAAACSFTALRTCFPILTWLPRYNLTWLRMDVLAGLTVGLTAVPQGLAYAEVAGLPVQYGLYSAFMGGFVYCVFGTSKDVTLGPTAIMSLLCSYYIERDPVYAVLLTLLCGIIQTAMAFLRLGFLLDFISYPVIKGFTCAAAVTIGFGQVKNILGLKGVPRQFVLQVYYTFHRIPEARVGDVILGVSCLFFLMMVTMMKSTLRSLEDSPSSLVQAARGIVWNFATIRNALVVIAATCVAYSTEVIDYHIFTLTGKTAKGLPPFSPPSFSETTANGTHVSFNEILLDLGGGLAVIPLMGVLESIAIAKAFAIWQPCLLCVFAGLTNILGSFVSAYPVTGSFGRTAVNSQTGVCTPAGGIFTGGMIHMNNIDNVKILHVVIVIEVVRQIWRVRKLDVLPFLVTFLVSFWEVQYGIVAGVAVSGLMLLYVVSRPKLKMSDHGVAVVELASGLHFPAIEHLSGVLRSHALHVSPPRSAVLDCHHVSSIDYTVVNELKDLLKQFKLHDVSLVFTGLKVGLQEGLERSLVLYYWKCVAKVVSEDGDL